MKLISPHRSGRVGEIVYINSGRYGALARRYVVPRNPRTEAQMAHRNCFASVSSCWRGLDPQQRLAWALAASGKYISTSDGKRVSLNGYNYYVSVNTKRASLGLPRYDVPVAEPSFNPNPVGPLAVSNVEGNITLKLRVPSQPAQYTVVQGAGPVSAGVSVVQHFPRLGLLPAAADGWSDVTELYAARYGVPTVGTVVFLRTCQHLDGWSDVPKLTSALVPAATPA
jgi:hypothetical protein